MRIERTKNTLRSIFFGFGYRIINIILPFISRTVILYILGEQYLGLSSLFSSVLSFLSLAELGVGSAMVYSMYKPIAENDDETICALLNLYKKYYRVIGSIILIIGIGLIPFLDKLIKGTTPAGINIYFLYFLYLLNAVLSYFLFAYKQSILLAFQRNDVESKIGMFITPISYIVMLGSLWITKSYYGYVVWLPIFTIITNIIRLIYVNKHYPQYVPKGNVNDDLKKSITKKVTALIGTKLNTVVLNAADNIVLSSFIGLTVTAMYGNYYYIMNSIIAFLGICYSAMTAGLGNSLQTETLEKNYKDFHKFSFINAWLIGWCAICLVCLYQPFMYLWAGEDLMFPFIIVLELGIYFYVYQIRKIPVVYKDAAGIWWEDRFRPYICMIVNVVLNVTLVHYIGVSGIILSTVFSLMISIPWENHTIFKYVFRRSSREYYSKMLYYFLVTVGVGAITLMICNSFENTFFFLMVKGIVCLIVPNVLFFILYKNRNEFKDSSEFVLNIIKKR